MIKESLSEYHGKNVSSSVSSVNGRGDAVVSMQEEKRKNGKGVRVSAVDTDKSKPVVRIEKTAKYEQLEPGDVLLMSSKKPPNRLHSLFRRASTAAQGGLNHAAMYVGNGEIVEGRIGQGVKKVSLGKGTRGLSYTVVRPNLPRRIRKKAATVAKTQVGREYSDGDLARTGALLAIVPDSLRKTIVGEKDVSSLDEDKAVQCAALVAGSYAKAGKRIVNMNYKYVAPVDLLSKTNSTIVKMKKAKNDAIQGTQYVITNSANQAKSKLNEFMNKTASAGELSLYCHVDATDWCPNGDVIASLAKFFTKEVKVEIYPRYLMPTVWSKDHCGKPYEKDYYAFRAYAGRDYCKIFVDETETKDSVMWVMLHELGHIALATSPFLFKGYRHLTAPDYFESDEAHEADPEEKMANEIAMSWMDMLGYGKVSYPRHWWRQRTIMNKAASLRGTLLGGGIGSVVGGGRAMSDAAAAKAKEDYLLDRSGKSLTKEQLKKRRDFHRKGIAAQAAKGGLLGGALGFGAGRAQKAFGEGVGELKSLRDSTLKKAREAGEDLLDSGKRKADDFVDSAKSKIDDSVSRGIDKGKGVADEFVDSTKGKLDDSIRQGKASAEDLLDKGKEKGSELLEEAQKKMDSSIEDAMNKSTAKTKKSVEDVLYGESASTGRPRAPHPGGLMGAIDEQRGKLPGYLGGGPTPDPAAVVPKKKGGLFGFFNKKASAHEALYQYHYRTQGKH